MESNYKKLLKISNSKKIDKAIRVPSNRRNLNEESLDKFIRFNNKYGKRNGRN